MRRMGSPSGKGTIGAAAGAVLMVGALAGSSVAVLDGTSAAATQSTRTTPCTTAGLDVWMNTAGVGSAGRMTFQLDFTNLSPHSCTLLGYPRVSGINQTGHQLGSAAARDTSKAPAKITLTSADSAQGLSAVSDTNTATALLETVDTGALARCHHVTANGFRVYAPGQTRSSTIPYPFVACSNTGPIYLYVQSVQHRGLRVSGISRSVRRVSR
jgi:Domain of unknown function (DUF4232)